MPYESSTDGENLYLTHKIQTRDGTAHLKDYHVKMEPTLGHWSSPGTTTEPMISMDTLIC